MIVFTEFICKRKGLSNKSLKLEITPVRVQTLTRVKSLKKDLLDSPQNSLLSYLYPNSYKSLRKNITP